MENLKKIISLHQASQLSGYHPDYLSSLLRKNEIKGEKLGGSWFTTEEEIKSYIFRQKIRNKNALIKYALLSFKRVNSNFIYALICLAVLSTGLYFYNKSEIQSRTASAQLSDTVKSVSGEEPKELKF